MKNEAILCPFYLTFFKVTKLTAVLIFLACISASAEITVLADTSISGTVTDEQGAPVEGVSIRVKGTTAGTQTDSSGNYSISVPENATLVFSFIGFTTREVLVNNQSVINVTLMSNAEDLEQVVVIGYGTQKKRDLTGSITSIEGSDIAKMPNVNPISSLQGRVPGLTVVNSGTPGTSPTVRIRGVNSVNSGDPLYVVDGVHQSNIDYLNMADIESIEVLRDPSSMAIFGLQAGNGVIVITTKRAAKGKTMVSLQSSAGIEKIINTIDVADAAAFKKLYSAQIANSGGSDFDYTNYTWDTDWQKEILHTAAVENSSLTISNSTDKSTTLFNLGHNLQEGVLKFGKYERFVGRLNEEIKVSKGIRVGGDITGTYWRLNNASVSLNNALWAAPIVGVREDENNYYSMPSFQRTQVGNPVATVYRNKGTSLSKGYRFVGSVFAEISFLNNFKFRSQFYTDLGFNNSRGYGALPFTMINLGENGNPTTRTQDANARTSVNQNADEFRKFQQDHTLTYTTVLNDDHSITALAGFTSIFESSTTLNGSRTDASLTIPRDPSFWYVGISEGSNPTTLGGGGYERSALGIFGRINYAYQNKYLLNATFRRDGISRLSPANRWGNFGSVGLGWVLTEEDFLKDAGGINFLKLRGAWGTVGNAQGIDDNIFRPGLKTSGAGVFGGNIYPSYAPAYLPDSTLKWEVVRGIDIGIDIRALDNRFTGEITLYDRKTKDIITDVPLLTSAGSLPFKTNLGTISNRGVELSLGWSDNIGNLTYGISPNFSYNKNEVESIGNNFDFTIFGNGTVNRTISGESIGHFYGYRQIGIYQSSADMEKMPAFADSEPGDIAYADLNGDGKITPEDRENLGSPFPAWSFGFDFSLAYKGFDFLLQGQGVAGNYIYLQRRVANFAPVNYEVNRVNAWTAPGTSNIEPILNNARPNNYLFSTYFLEPGDYFRLRTVQVGYTFAAGRLSKAGITALRLYISGQNVHTWSKTTGYTPEVPVSSILAGGADNGVYPLPATYTFGFNASF